MFKYKLKSFTAFLLVFVMSLSLCGCGSADNNTTTEAVTNSSSNITTSVNTTDDNNTDSDAASVISDTALSEREAYQERFDEYLDKVFKEAVTKDSITLHYSLSHPEDYDITPPEVTYGETNLSADELAREKDRSLKDLDELEGFDYSLLSSSQQFTYDILHNIAETNIKAYDFAYLYEPFAYTSGLHSNLPITLSEYKLQSKDDVETYIQLLKLAPDYFQAYLDFESVKIEKGLFMSANSANEVIRQCNDFIAEPEKNLLIETFNNNINNVEGLTAAEISDYKKANYDAVMNYIIPTYQKVISFFDSNKNRGKNDLGLSHFENGTEYYKYLIMNKVGSDKTPEEIIELLDSQIKTLMAQLTTTAMTKYDAYMSYIKDYDNLYKNIDPKATIEYFEKAAKDHFPSIPDIDFTIEPVHESLVNIVSPAFFVQPQLDDYTHNHIYTNLDKDGSNNLWSTLAHEGVPGHMYQFVYFLSNKPMPIRTVISFTGYTEGWATYTELMSFDYYDKYEDECYADLERLNSMLNLLVSARVEIGVNYEGWSLEQTKAYLTNNGFSGDVAETLMNYVIAEPVNYQMYVLGWLEFKELREYAEKELGDNFDEIEFHKVILDAGPCQFYLLRNVVEEYVSSKLP